jgi:hypothetical protein
VLSENSAAAVQLAIGLTAPASPRRRALSTWDSGVRGLRADSIGTDRPKSIVSLAPLEALELRLSDQRLPAHGLQFGRVLGPFGVELAGRI